MGLGGKRRKGESRVRSGCWTCRERRVKCPEERPVCSHCLRLDLVCRYETRLTWQHEFGESGSRRPAVVNSGPRDTPARYRDRIEDWMFVSTTVHDFDPDEDPPSDEEHIDSPPQCSLKIGRPKPPRHSPDTSDIRLLPSPDLLRRSPQESYLWDYFDKFIAPRCALHPRINPYRDVVLRVASSTAHGSLYHCVMAVSAKQMQILGHGAPASPSWAWSYRDRALASLRGQIQSHEVGSARGPGIHQIVASSLMMCFLEILDNCSRSWTVHADFIRSFLKENMEIKENLQHVDAQDCKDLYQFAATYFYAHDVLASTLSPWHTGETDESLKHFLDDPIMETLTGCPTELVALLAEIKELASDMQDYPTTEPQRGGLPLDLRRRRDDIERRLTDLEHRPPSTSDHELPGAAADDAAEVAETKRLASLMYLYARIDNAPPSQPRMMRLTAQLLALLPRISLRTNTVLWPLVIVAALGVRSESEDDRRAVLVLLDTLQRTRQLANVIKSRYVVKAVWRARDLISGDALKGWSILERRQNSLSFA